jgi:hypothetical protein
VHPGEGAAGLQPIKHQKEEFKNTDFVDIMISKVLPDLPFSRNQPLKNQFRGPILITFCVRHITAQSSLGLDDKRLSILT